MNTPLDMTTEQAERRHWMSVLARAETTELDDAWSTFENHPAFTWVRRPETGMTMVRGRASGSGRPFNLGEMSITRCALRLESDILGVAYVRGRDQRQCELAALFDAMMQDPRWHDDTAARVVRPLARSQSEVRQEARSKTEATRVDFFTMATGRKTP